MTVSDTTPLSYLVINGEAKKVMPFSFKNQNGESISNEDYAGKVYLVEFFLFNMSNHLSKNEQKPSGYTKYLSRSPDFGIASFTINPEYDTQEVLKTYAENYGVTNPNWHFMTGEKEAIYNLANTGFNLYAAQVEGSRWRF